MMDPFCIIDSHLTQECIDTNPAQDTKTTDREKMITLVGTFWNHQLQM